MSRPPPTSVRTPESRSTKRYDADVGRGQHGYPPQKELSP
jgi:hypothetical protein